jgi:hypothetical protein
MDYVLHVDGYCAIEIRNSIRGIEYCKGCPLNEGKVNVPDVHRHIRRYKKYGKLHGIITEYIYHPNGTVISYKRGEYILGLKEGKHIHAILQNINSSYYRSTHNYTSGILNGRSELYQIDDKTDGPYSWNRRIVKTPMDHRNYNMYKGEPEPWGIRYREYGYESDIFI